MTAPSEPANVSESMQEAKANAERIGKLLGIEAVVVVDDEYSRAPTLAALLAALQVQVNQGRAGELAAIEDLAAVPFEEEELWGEMVGELWTGLDNVKRQGLFLAVTGAAAAAVSFGPLEEILQSFKPRFLSLLEWREQSKELLAELSSAKTLFLFDLDMSKEGDGREDEGMQIIAELLLNGSLIHFCGLLSHTISVDNEYTDWVEFSKKHKIEDKRDRFVVISKRHLPDQPVEFSRRLKRAAITPYCNELKTMVCQVLDAAHATAKQKLEGLNIYDFEQVVFESSHVEGVWEPDTVLRVFGLYNQLEARARLKQDDKVEAVASQIRSVIDLPFRPVDAPKASSREIYQLELYEKGEYLNSHHLPLELGDIFRKTAGKKEFVLLAQPCDIMCRVDRETRVDEVYLAPITTCPKDKRPSDNPLAYCELEFYSEDAEKVAYADFRNVYTVPVDALDLSVFNPDGAMAFSVGAKAPKALIPAWLRRYEKRQEEIGKLIERFAVLKNGQGALPGEAEQLVIQWLTGAAPGVLQGSIDIKARKLSYDLKRVARVKQPRASMVLRRFTYYLSRDAFEHDLTRSYNAKRR